MRFWDTSAVVPLLVTQPLSGSLHAEYDRDPSLVVWWATRVECASAIAHLEREGGLNLDEAGAARARLDALSAAWSELQPTTPVRRKAERLLRVHALRAADALQLAAALAAADDDPRSLPVLTTDDRLALAAEREGFLVVRPAR